jgi:acyl dehydratase
MRAIESNVLPSNLRSYAGIFWHRRTGLKDPAAMPRIERSIDAVQLDAAWLNAYRNCVGLDTQVTSGLPPLALQIAVAPLHLSILADAQFPFKALGLVHVSQQVSQMAAIAQDQRLTLRAYTTQAQWARRGMTFGLVTEALADGQLVWRGETTALASCPSPAQATVSTKAADTADQPEIPWRQVLALDAPEPLGRRYAAIAGDLNPIHQHALLARPFGFRQAIIHGTWTLARAMAAAELPQTSPYTLNAQFRKPVSLPSSILVWARNSDRQDDIKVTDKDGQTTHVSAQITR